MTHPIEIVCHRGANHLAPENTFPAARHCIEWGADWLEIDVNTSRDGVMYVFHGPGLERTTSGTGRIYEHDAETIDTLDAGSWFDPAFEAERIPRLEEFLAWVDGRIGLFFDVKWAPLDELVQLVNRFGLRDRSFFWFGRDKLARQLRALDPGLALKINVSTREDIEQARADFGARIVEFGMETEADIRAEDTSRELINACRHLGVRSMIKYGGNTPAVFEQIIRLRPDMANIDRADEFQRLMMQTTAGT